MKKARKLITFILVTVMVLSMSMTAWAEPEKSTITITGAADGSEYSAYKLLDVTVGTLDGGEKTYAYTVNETYKTVLESVIQEMMDAGITVNGVTSNEQVIPYIQGLDDSEIRTFADKVYAAIKVADPAIGYDATTASDDLSTDDFDESQTKNIFENVDQGYYLIVETKKGSDPADTFSLVMLNTAGQSTVNIETKEDVPTVDKVIVDGSANGAKYGDVAVGDPIEFKITGTVSDKYSNYKSYYYSIGDTMSKGLSLNLASVKVYVVNGNDKVDVTGAAPYFVVVDTSNEDNNGFKATANLKELDENNDEITISETTQIVVEYTATVTDRAVSGTNGNTNTAIISYENDPYHEDDGDPNTTDDPTDPGKTPPSTNVVFTFDVIVNKTDGEDNPLEGAGFTLYEETATDTWTQVGEEVKGADLTTFRWDGLDAGKYKLAETTVPDGYNKAEDVIFTINPTYDTTEDPVEMTGLMVDGFTTVTLETGEASITIENLTGSLLPSTGGIGTTIFYIAGGVLVLIAVVMLVTKKRMKED